MIKKIYFFELVDIAGETKNIRKRENKIGNFVFFPYFCLISSLILLPLSFLSSTMKNVKNFKNLMMMMMMICIVIMNGQKHL